MQALFQSAQQLSKKREGSRSRPVPLTNGSGRPKRQKHCHKTWDNNIKTLTVWGGFASAMTAYAAVSLVWLHCSGVSVFWLREAEKDFFSVKNKTSGVPDSKLCIFVTDPTRNSTPEREILHITSGVFELQSSVRDPYLWLMDLTLDPTPFFSDFKDEKIIIFFIFFLI